MDPDLGAWLAGEGHDQREMIVESKLPSQTVRMGQSPSGWYLPHEVITAGHGDRATTLRESQD